MFILLKIKKNYPKAFQRVIYRKEKRQIETAYGASEIIYMSAASKKQLGKLNKVKKEKAAMLAEQAAGGSEAAKKKLKKLEKKIK